MIASELSIFIALRVKNRPGVGALLTGPEVGFS